MDAGTQRHIMHTQWREALSSAMINADVIYFSTPLHSIVLHTCSALLLLLIAGLLLRRRRLVTIVLPS